ncbi:hypothetical protein ACFE04_002553 [Oxalis oulophora]
MSSPIFFGDRPSGPIVGASELAAPTSPSLTGGKIGDRLMAEAEINLAINVIPSISESYEVQERGELQLGILIENMRREGLELSILPPRVMYKTEGSQKVESIEEVTIELYLIGEVRSLTWALFMEILAGLDCPRPVHPGAWLVIGVSLAVTLVEQDLCIGLS